jgi:hypothetical protein
MRREKERKTFTNSPPADPRMREREGREQKGLDFSINVSGTSNILTLDEEIKELYQENAINSLQ